MYVYRHDHSDPEYHGPGGCNGHVFGYVELLCHERYAYGCFCYFRGDLYLGGPQWLHCDRRDGYGYRGRNLYADGDQSDLGLYGYCFGDCDGQYDSAGGSGDCYVQ
jgi:hypothetical protein